MLTEIFGTVLARGGCSTHAPFIQRPLISFAHLSPLLLILATRFNRGPCIHVAGVCLGIGFWSCHVGGRLPAACSKSEKAWRDQRRKGPHHTRKHQTKHEAERSKSQKICKYIQYKEKKSAKLISKQKKLSFLQDLQLHLSFLHSLRQHFVTSCQGGFAPTYWKNSEKKSAEIATT